MDKNLQLANIGEMSLSEATKPLLIVSRLVGINPKYRWHKIYTIFILVCDFWILYYIWRYYSSFSLDNYYFKILVHGLEDVCRIISLLVILGPSLFGQNRYTIPLKDFASVDESLKSLGVYFDNRGTYRFQIFLVLYVGLITFLYWLMKFGFNVLFPVRDAELFRVVVSGWPHYFTITIVCATADCFFSSTLSIIRKRFKEINFIIHRAQEYSSHLRINFLEVSRARTDNYVVRDLRRLRKQYHDLWLIANRVNETYGLHLLMAATTSLMLITSNLWKSYGIFINYHQRKSHDPGDILEGIIWAFFPVTRILFLIKACESTVVEAKTAPIMLQELEMKGGQDDLTKSEIRNFLTQLQLEVPKFTACGLFTIDFTLICSILGAASTYLVILIQMDN